MAALTPGCSQQFAEDMSGVRAAAAALGHQVSLVDALGIVLVMAANNDNDYERAAARWLPAWRSSAPRSVPTTSGSPLQPLKRCPTVRRRRSRSSRKCALATGSTT